MAQISQSQLQETAEKLFTSIDTNNNGKLDLDEVREFSMQMFLRVKPDGVFDEGKFQENFAQLDKNSDGSVSKIELLQSLVEKAKQAGALE